MTFGEEVGMEGNCQLPAPNYLQLRNASRHQFQDLGGVERQKDLGIQGCGFFLFSQW